MNPPLASARPALRAAQTPSCGRAISRMRGSSCGQSSDHIAGVVLRTVVDDQRLPVRPRLGA